MNVVEETLDDALRSVFEEIIKSGSPVEATKGENRELVGASIKISDPRARLSRTETRGKPFSCIGELLWYLAGSDRLDFIEYYLPLYREFVEDDGSVWGAYGPRLFPQEEKGQFADVCKLLQRKQSSRQAVLQIFSANDITSQRRDTPCTCTLQFLVRDSQLHLIAYMRSSDAFIGLPHDVFAFTMLQEIMAVQIGVDVGSYHHFAGSLHIYEKNIDAAQQLLSEGFQSTLRPMPRMPLEENPMQAVEKLLKVEEMIRHGDVEPYDSDLFAQLPEYWQDFATLLAALKSFRMKNRGSLELARSRLHSSVYDVFVARKLDTLSNSASRRERL